MGAPGSTYDKPGITDHKPGSTWEHLWQVWMHWRQVWQHLKSQQSGLGKTLSSLGMLLVRLEVIAATYHSMIIKTHVFGLYSQLWIYIVTHRHSISGLGAGSAGEQLEVRLNMTIDWTQRYSQRPCFSEFGDAHGGRDWAGLEMYLEARIGLIGQLAWRW